MHREFSADKLPAALLRASLEDASYDKARALTHYSAQAAEAQKQTPHEYVAQEIARVLALVKAQTWADESIDLVVEDLETAATHWECVYGRTAEQISEEQREFDEELLADARRGM